jgi:hypothetical protein
MGLLAWSPIVGQGAYVLATENLNYTLKNLNAI